MMGYSNACTSHVWKVVIDKSELLHHSGRRMWASEITAGTNNSLHKSLRQTKDLELEHGDDRIDRMRVGDVEKQLKRWNQTAAIIISSKTHHGTCYMQDRALSNPLNNSIRIKLHRKM